MHRDAVVEHGLEGVRVAPHFDQHLAQATRVVLKHGELDLIAHPAVGIARHAAQRALHATLADLRRPRRAGDVDRAGPLRGFRQKIHVIERIILAVKTGVLVGPKSPQSLDHFFQSSGALFACDAHHFELLGRHRMLSRRVAHTCREPRAAAR